jgi:probable F420-dependent oxidoreductase
MKVGIFVAPTKDTIPIVELAKLVETLGFESLWVPDHPVIPKDLKTKRPSGGELADYYRRLLDPFMVLAAAAGGTESILLGTAVLVVPERSPLITAKQVASLDLISDGRVRLGIGCGWIREEAEVMGADFDNRWAQTRDHVLAMKACWASGTASFQSRYVNFPELYCEPKPVQQPHPPVSIANAGDTAMRRIAEYGDGWIARSDLADVKTIEASRRRLETLFKENGRDFSRFEVTLFGCRPERAVHQRFADAGVDRILQIVKHGPAQETEKSLIQWGEALL